ncbi:Kre9 protein [Saccharomycopsis crataegensis]|uniref:Kre9 protein n=1 Tax=Saccharomycopsis crataegensis TaxID=43959 RepID=A0AAV5QI58_9ASCO|nr:Kre9 protein [Saccharomycopsis crataegensis]
MKSPLLHLLPLLVSTLFFVSLSSADVSISSPKAGSSFTVSGSSASITVSWIDSGTSPSIDDAETFTFTLCTGPNSDISAVTTLASNQKISSSSFTASIPDTVGADGVYYIQVYAVYSSGYTIHYTRRFQLNGMTGTITPVGLVTDAPPTAQVAINTGTTEAAAIATMSVSASFSVTYTLQTGIYRFAPMQMQPGSVVTATTWSRKYPASAVTYYSTKATSASQVSTLTPGWSYTRTSLINYVSPLGTPTAFYPASQKVIKPTIKTTSNVKRFFDLD